jgi:hypothetical protein
LRQSSKLIYSGLITDSEGASIIDEMAVLRIGHMFGHCLAGRKRKRKEDPRATRLVQMGSVLSRKGACVVPWDGWAIMLLFKSVK